MAIYEDKFTTYSGPPVITIKYITGGKTFDTRKEAEEYEAAINNACTHTDSHRPLDTEDRVIWRGKLSDIMLLNPEYVKILAATEEDLPSYGVYWLKSDEGWPHKIEAATENDLYNLRKELLDELAILESFSETLKAVADS